MSKLAKNVGEKILSSMNAKCAADYSFKRDAQAVTMASKVLRKNKQ